MLPLLTLLPNFWTSAEPVGWVMLLHGQIQPLGHVLVTPELLQLHKALGWGQNITLEISQVKMQCKGRGSTNRLVLLNLT